MPPIVTDQGLRLTLGEVARIAVADGPAMIRSENGRLSAFVYVDVRGRDLASVVRDLQRMWAQSLAIALVIAGGVATLIMAVGSARSTPRSIARGRS